MWDSAVCIHSSDKWKIEEEEAILTKYTERNFGKIQ
jgi:hypothetical protein